MKVIYTKGRTVNLGDFNSMRVDIGIELDCEDGAEDDTLARLKAWVESKLAQEKTR